VLTASVAGCRHPPLRLAHLPGPVEAARRPLLVQASPCRGHPRSQVFRTVSTLDRYRSRIPGMASRPLRSLADEPPADRLAPIGRLSWSSVPLSTYRPTGRTASRVAAGPRPGFVTLIAGADPGGHPAFAGALTGFDLQSLSSRRSVSVSGAMPSCRSVDLSLTLRGCEADKTSVDFRVFIPAGVRRAEAIHDSPGLLPFEARARRPPRRSPAVVPAWLSSALLLAVQNGGATRFVLRRTGRPLSRAPASVGFFTFCPPPPPSL
jgi:hypothetical protein